MSNDAYQNAVSRRDELNKELEKVEQFLLLYQQFESIGPVQQNGTKPHDSGPKTAESSSEPHRRKSGKKLNPTVLKDLVKVVLKEANQPLSRREIVEAIEAKNYAINSKNKTGYIGSLLHRFKSELSSENGNGYWFTGFEPGQIPPDGTKR